MLTSVRAEVSERLREVFLLAEHIRHLESTPPSPDPPEVKIMRGLFYVHLYAALEYATCQGVQHFLEAVATLKISTNHLNARFLSVALDPGFSAMRSVGEEKKWSSRVRLLDLQLSTESQSINADIFGLYLQNIWVEKLETLFKCLNINLPVVPDPAYRLYVDELVERRNGIAHGRFSALGIGAARRSPELLIRYNAISTTCFYLLDCLEQQYLQRGLILEVHRPAYP